MSFKSQPSSTAQTVVQEPNSLQRQLIQPAYQAAYDYFFGPNAPTGTRPYAGGQLNIPQYFPGSTVAARTPEEQAGRAQLIDYYRAQAPRVTEGAQAALETQLNAPDLAQNPYFGQYLESVTRPATERLFEQYLPSIRAEAVGSGGVGGSRQGVAEGLAIRGTEQAIQDTSRQLTEGFYERGLGAQGRALALAPTVFQLGAAPGQGLATVGLADREYEQGIINEAIRRFEFERDAPLLALERLNAFTSPHGTQQTTTAAGPSTSPALGALSGASATIGLLGGLGKLGVFGTGGAAAALGVPGVGAIVGLGALLGLLE